MGEVFQGIDERNAKFIRSQHVFFVATAPRADDGLLNLSPKGLESFVVPQFWVDQERLLFVRLLQPAGPGGERTQEIQFNQYEPLGGGWIAPEVVFMTDGVMTMREVYRDVRANMELGAGLFDVETWRPVRWANQ